MKNEITEQGFKTKKEKEEKGEDIYLIFPCVTGTIEEVSFNHKAL
jgi:hypothetical protein